MSAAVLTLILVAFVGVLGLLAQTARGSRGAEVTLIVVVLALSVLVAALGTVTGLGLLLMAANDAPQEGVNRLTFAVAGGAALLAGVVGVGLCVPPLRRVVNRHPGGGFWTDPPTFLALWLFVMVIANNAVSLLLFDQLPNAASLFPTERLSLGAVLTSQLPFVAVALLGVGFGVRRTARETLDRLAYGGVSARHLRIVVPFVGVALALPAPADALFSRLQPHLFRQVGGGFRDPSPPPRHDPPPGQHLR